VELDDGHVYEVNYGAQPVPGEVAHLCVEVSRIDNSAHYAISLDRAGDPNSKARKARLVK